jgi:Na+-translocating ferredoxin:NAD+ oxidoreductase RnfG subunit
MVVRALALVVLALSCQLTHADVIYQTQADFLKEAFNTEVKAKVLWLDKPLQNEIRKMLDHNYPQARLRYWREGDISVWVLEEIGKEYPITAGFIITQNKITRTQVLTYRETRGAEIHLNSFLTQFVGSSLKADKLSNNVDGIAGATLSVNAMIKMAKVALMLNQKAP